MHLWRIVNGRPSWLDAVWVSGIITFGYQTWIWSNRILDYLEPKGTAYLVLGYVIFLVMFFGFLGGYLAVFVYIQKRLAPVYWLPRWTWFYFSSIACMLLQQLIYECADALWPMAHDPTAKPWPIDIGSSSRAIDVHVQHFYSASLAISIVFLTLCYALTVACVERFPDFANRVAIYVMLALGALGVAAKITLALRH